MKVAIMGAGLSGLTCALMLERNGIYPTILESRKEVGDRFVNGEIFLSVLNRPIIDPLRYLSEEYQIYLMPTSHLSELTIYSENNKAVINEHLGHVNIRGRHEQSYEKQLARLVKSEIQFQSELSYEDVVQHYTHVVLATGDASYAIRLQNFEEHLSVSIKGATVEGNFERSSAATWLNNTYAPRGYSYLLPFSDTEANIVIAHPDLEDSSDEKINQQWKQFYERVCMDFQQTLKITDQFQIKNYKIGACKYPRIGNTFFTGNCFGTIMPFLGFGQFEAILTGIYAAQDLCGSANYEEKTKHLRRSYHHSLTIRQGMERLDNEAFDVVVQQLNGYIGKRIFKRSPFNPLKLFSYFLRPFV